ncbi:MAG: hypothetical protein Q7T16_00455 [Candidatus Burarchaeum sp.]|nr:hypothetical protein [Candidatus Burarchaeum sp.]MDO8339110.1 hypothetical protein [Candidatus Burarchaeum sp.]
MSQQMTAAQRANTLRAPSLQTRANAFGNQNLIVSKPRRPNRYWKNIDNVDREILNNVDENGFAPRMSDKGVIERINIVLRAYHGTTYPARAAFLGLKLAPIKTRSLGTLEEPWKLVKRILSYDDGFGRLPPVTSPVTINMRQRVYVGRENHGNGLEPIGRTYERIYRTLGFRKIKKWEAEFENGLVQLDSKRSNCVFCEEGPVEKTPEVMAIMGRMVLRIEELINIHVKNEQDRAVIFDRINLEKMKNYGVLEHVSLDKVGKQNGITDRRVSDMLWQALIGNLGRAFAEEGIDTRLLLGLAEKQERQE